MRELYQLVIPSTVKDFLRNMNNYYMFFENLPIREIVFIGPADLQGCIEQHFSRYCNEGKMSFINENSVMRLDDVTMALKRRLEHSGVSMSPDSRPGWYYQQFLKMYYATSCNDEYYIVWDSDTIPLHTIEFFEQGTGKPFFDMKIEYNKAYFDTISNIFPDFTKSSKGSFIAEHMIMSKEYMLELIEEIMDSPLLGDTFYEKIFYAVDIENMALGFSEFETYGTYMTQKHPDVYAYRQWRSMRSAGLLFEPSKLTVEDYEWLAKDYDAMTFESYNQIVPELHDVFSNKELRKNVTAGEMYQIVQDSGILTGCKDR